MKNKRRPVFLKIVKSLIVIPEGIKAFIVTTSKINGYIDKLIILST